MTRIAETVHKVEYTTILLVPSILNFLQTDVHRLPDEFRTLQTLTEVHDKPHGFDGMTRIELPTVEAVNKVAVIAQRFNNKTELRTIEHIHDFVEAIADGFLQEIRRNERFHLEGNIAENHGEVEGLEGAGTCNGFVPLSLGIVYLGKDNVESAAGDSCIIG